MYLVQIKPNLQRGMKTFRSFFTMSPKTNVFYTYNTSFLRVLSYYIMLAMIVIFSIQSITNLICAHMILYEYICFYMSLSLNKWVWMTSIKQVTSFVVIIIANQDEYIVTYMYYACTSASKSNAHAQFLTMKWTLNNQRSKILYLIIISTNLQKSKSFAGVSLGMILLCQRIDEWKWST